MSIGKIEVIGSGCKKCKTLHERTVEVVNELGIQSVVEYSTDVGKIVSMGLMQSPVLAVDGKPLFAGVLPEKDKLKQVLSGYVSNKTGHSDADKDVKAGKCGTCTCGGNC